FERIAYVKHLAQIKYLGFLTNAQWLHKVGIDKLLDSGIDWLSISMSFAGREEFRECVGVDRYEQTLENIITLIEKNNMRGRKVEIGFSVKPARSGTVRIIKNPDFKRVNSVMDNALYNEVVRQGFCVDDWQGKVELPDFLKKRPILPRFFHPCKLLYDSLIVFSDGTIGVCPCRDFEAESALILGHIKDMSIPQAWGGEKIKIMRDDWRKKNKIPAICKVCSHYIY
ncbi:MAG: SPASM domain-containing protein, partial [Candidatus Pacebacteria bacterium]|nr:SPASM domain-containing protein [Candidatus Paceibacterota bacterium]